MDRGIPPATPGFKKLMIVVANSGSINFKKNRYDPDQGSVV
jgi:hypothetical protein